MPFRAKLKKTFSSKKSKSENEAVSADIYPPRRSDIEYYEPHEIPKSKYRGRVDPKHQETLDAFSFSFADERRGSVLSGTFSPGGTKSQSRRPSYIPEESHLGTSTLSLGDDTVGDEDSLDGASSGDSASDSNTLTDNGSNKYAPMTLGKLDSKDVFSYKNDNPFSIQELEHAMSRFTIDQQRTQVTA